MEFISHLDPWSYSIEICWWCRNFCLEPRPCKSCSSGLTLYLANVWKLGNHVLYAITLAKADTIICKQTNLRLNIIPDVIDIQRQQQGAKDSSLGQNENKCLRRLWTFTTLCCLLHKNGQSKEAYRPLCYIRASCISGVHVRRMFSQTLI